MPRAAAPLLAWLLVAGAAFALLTAGGGAPGADGPPEPDGHSVFARMGCGGCHALAAAGSAGGPGPDLDRRLASHTPASLRAAIVDPPSSRGFVQMPADFGERMSDRELDALVAFLLAGR